MMYSGQESAHVVTVVSTVKSSVIAVRARKDVLFVFIIVYDNVINLAAKLQRIKLISVSHPPKYR